jgi:EAL domain-containing protein (putative c-di-GMP-specific phosphodiesterase class I)
VDAHTGRVLGVELTESTSMADPLHALAILGRLDAMGVQQLDLPGCHAARGDHISRPITPDELMTWLNGRPASAAAPA